MRFTSKFLALALLAFVACTTATPPAPAPERAPAATPPPPSTSSRPVVELQTTAGTITLELYRDVAPNHVRNFIDLAKSGFYDGTNFHRVIPGFMIQGGDPNTKNPDREQWGRGGSEKTLQPEFSTLPHERGTLSMARAQDPASARSQFFICVADAPFLNGQYTVFGKVLSGMDVADTIVNAARDSRDQPNEPTVITRAVVVRE